MRKKDMYEEYEREKSLLPGTQQYIAEEKDEEKEHSKISRMYNEKSLLPGTQQYIAAEKEHSTHEWKKLDLQTSR